ncbi:MAG: hypothetical protein AB1499_17070 [Nitrospirota bacterium]
MRYNEDVVNAEKWNPALKKTKLLTVPGKDGITKKQKSRSSGNAKVARKTAIQSVSGKVQRTYDKLMVLARPAVSSSSSVQSKTRLTRRKKKGMFILSGLMTHLISGAQKRK